MMRNRLIIKNKLGWIAGVLLLLSCCIDEHTVYHYQQSVDNRAWSNLDTIIFQVDSLQKGHTYQLTIEGRLAKTFAYQDLVLALQTGSCPVDTLFIPIYQENNNTSWKGEKPYFLDFQAPAIPYTPQQSIGTIRITHIMQHRFAEGINSIGIHIEQ